MNNGVMLSLVVPCYNEEEAVPLFIEAVTPVLNALRAARQVTSEIIFIDDGSRDNTPAVIRKLTEGGDRVESNIRCVRFSRNFGKEAAMYAGIEKAKGEYVCVLDVDLQDPPALVPDMLAAVQSGGYDCAGSRRVSRKGEPPVRSFFARQFYRIMRRLSGMEIVDGARDFRLMNRKMADAVLSLGEYNRFSKGIFPWIGFTTKWFEYENIRRSAGETKWSFWKLLLYSADGITAFSVKPLAIASLAGILFFFLSLLLIVFIIVRKLIWGDPVAGWPSLVCIILLSGGIQLITTGILGQYLAKTYLEIKRRPLYIIDEEW